MMKPYSSRSRSFAWRRMRGFTVADVRSLLTEFDRATPASTRWQKLARRKLDEVVQRIEHAQRMKTLLEGWLRCRCDTLGQCVQRRGAKLRDRSDENGD